MAKSGKPIFWVDIPDSTSFDPECLFVNVATFNKKEDAIKYVIDVYGADEDGRLKIITEGHDT